MLQLEKRYDSRGRDECRRLAPKGNLLGEDVQNRALEASVLALAQRTEITYTSGLECLLEEQAGHQATA